MSVSNDFVNYLSLSLLLKRFERQEEQSSDGWRIHSSKNLHPLWCPSASPLHHANCYHFSIINRKSASELWAWGVTIIITQCIICFLLTTLEYLITVYITAKSKGVIPFTCWAFKLILKVLNWSTTSNCPSLQAIWNRVFHYVSFIDDVRLLNTLEYKIERFFLYLCEKCEKARPISKVLDRKKEIRNIEYWQILCFAPNNGGRRNSYWCYCCNKYYAVSRNLITLAWAGVVALMKLVSPGMSMDEELRASASTTTTTHKISYFIDFPGLCSSSSSAPPRL